MRVVVDVGERGGGWMSGWVGIRKRNTACAENGGGGGRVAVCAVVAGGEVGVGGGGEGERESACGGGSCGRGWVDGG